MTELGPISASARAATRSHDAAGLDQPGVSVIIPTYNGAKRLGPTLAHLAAQRVGTDLPWEVILVDNASTDGTAAVARATWPADAPAPLRVVVEPRPGASGARQRGIREARYGLITLVDDDNWLGPDYVQLASDLMRAHPDVGACGGCSHAVCDGEPPPWFECYKQCYAVGPQAAYAGSVLSGRGWLWSAGVAIRKRAWQSLVDQGFHTILPGRTGSKLTSGEDLEMCYALRLAGWDLWYEPGLELRHFLPAGRLDWVYLRRLYRGFGASTVGHDAYLVALGRGPSWSGVRRRLRRTWQWQVLTSLKWLQRSHAKLAFPHRSEGNPDVLVIEERLGRLNELLRMRGAYDRTFREILAAPWRHSHAGRPHDDRGLRR